MQAWATEDGDAPWSVEDVMTAPGSSPAASEVLVLSDLSGVHAIPATSA